MISRQEMCDLLQKRSSQFKNSNIPFKVHFFWEHNKICKTKREIFCDLLKDFLIVAAISQDSQG